MAEMFELGFQIDTRPLAQTSTAAQAAAAAVTQLGTAEERLGQTSQRTADDLRRVTQEANAAARATAGAGGAQGGAADATTRFQQQLQSLTGSLRMNQGDLQSLVALLRGQQGLVGGLGAASGALARMVGALGPVGIALAGVAVAGGVAAVAFNKISVPLAEAQDRMALFEARMRNALGSTSAAATSMDRLYKSTQQTGLGFRETADAFLRLARNGEALGATTEQLMQLTDTVQKLGAVSGASRGEIGSGMLQLSQALASGRLNGDELRSIMENMPALAKAIADNLGVSIGQLRAMGAAGELTGQKVFQALLKATDQAKKEFESLPDTVERANQRSADAMDKFLAELGKKWNQSQFVASVKNFFADTTNKATALLQGPSLDQQITALEGRLNLTEAPWRKREIEAEIKVLRARRDEEAIAAASAEAANARKIAIAPMLAAAAMGANEFDDYEKKVKKTRESVEQLAAALKQAQANPTGEEESKLIPTLTRQLGVARAELAGMAEGLAKVKREMADTAMADRMGGGGGGSGIVQQAIGQQRSASTKGVGGRLQDYINLGVDQAIQKADAQVASLERQTSAQERLGKVIGATRAEVREAEIANELLQKRFELFGTLQGKGIDAFMDRYGAALRKNKEAAEAFANAQARVNEQLQINIARAQLGAVGSPYEQRRIASDMQAAETAKRDPALAALQRERFNLGEESQTAQTVFGLRQNIEANRALSRVGMTSAEQREIELSRRIAEAQRGVAPGQRGEIATLMRQEDDTAKNREYAAQETALQQQLKMLFERQKLNGLHGDELRVQTTLLQKRTQLEAAGAPQEVIDRQIQITEQIERQTIAFEKRKRSMDTIVGSFEQAATGFGDALKSGLEKSLESGTKAGLKAFEQNFRSAVRKMGADMTYEIGIRPFVEAMKNMAVAFGQKIASSLFGFSGYGDKYAMGGVFGAQKFAAGGAFTNSVVTQPTLFAFANGGALGLMGEAGPEAIMPLKRGRDGALGVVSNGGGDVSVVINDMRGSRDTEQIQVAQSRGPDNRRMLQVMVRDEVRRSMRSGELDTDMRSNFGVNRSVARK